MGSESEFLRDMARRDKQTAISNQATAMEVAERTASLEADDPRRADYIAHRKHLAALRKAEKLRESGNYTEAEYLASLGAAGVRRVTK